MALGNGKVVYQFGAVDCFTRKRVAALESRLTSHHSAEFLKQVVAQFPFQVQAIQPDGGSKFLKEFGAAIAELRLTHYFNRPNYPQSLPRTGYGGNGRIEASAPTGRRLPIKPRATRHQSSSINTGSILIPHERRSCAI